MNIVELSKQSSIKDVCVNTQMYNSESDISMDFMNTIIDMLAQTEESCNLDITEPLLKDEHDEKDMLANVLAMQSMPVIDNFEVWQLISTENSEEIDNVVYDEMPLNNISHFHDNSNYEPKSISYIGNREIEDLDTSDILSNYKLNIMPQTDLTTVKTDIFEQENCEQLSTNSMINDFQPISDFELVSDFESISDSMPTNLNTVNNYEPPDSSLKEVNINYKLISSNRELPSVNREVHKTNYEVVETKTQTDVESSVNNNAEPKIKNYDMEVETSISNKPSEENNKKDSSSSGNEFLSTSDMLSLRNENRVLSDNTVFKVGEVIDLNDDNAAKVLTDKISIKISDNIEEFEIELYPKNLGKISVNIVCESGKTVVNLKSDNVKAREILAMHSVEVQSILERNTGNQTVVRLEQNELGNNTNYQENTQQSNDERQRQKQFDRVYEMWDEKDRANLDFVSALRLGFV